MFHRKGKFCTLLHRVVRVIPHIQKKNQQGSSQPSNTKVTLKLAALLPIESEPPAPILSDKAWRDNRRKLQPAKSILKESGGPRCAKSVNFRLTSANEYSCRRHEKRSSFQRLYGQDTQQRSGSKRLRYSPTTLKASAALARKKANLLAKSCGRLSGNAKASACPATGSPKRGRNFLLDSGASFNIIGRDELTREELKTLRLCKRIRLNTAGGILECNYTATVYVTDLGRSFDFLVLPSCQPVLSMGRMAEADYEFS